jgi:hypothetical protein
VAEKEVIKVELPKPLAERAQTQQVIPPRDPEERYEEDHYRLHEARPPTPRGVQDPGEERNYCSRCARVAPPLSIGLEKDRGRRRKIVEVG